jgi:hypothetical protein
MPTVPSHLRRAPRGLVLVGTVTLVAGCSFLHSGPPEINGLSYTCAVGQTNWQGEDFHRTPTGRFYNLVLTNTTGQDIQVSGVEVVQFNSAGKQINLDSAPFQDPQ